MNILVTGANGYLGRGIARKLLEQGHTVIAADRTRAGLPGGAIYAPGDLFTVANPYLYYRSPDCCLYLASQDGFRHQSGSHIENLPHHWRCIQNMLEEGLPHIAVMGSVHEIGPHEGMIHPDTPMAPVTPYGIAKETLYRLTRAEAERLDRAFQWLRAYYVVPVTGREKEAYLEALREIEAGRKTPVGPAEAITQAADTEEAAYTGTQGVGRKERKEPGVMEMETADDKEKAQAKDTRRMRRAPGTMESPMEPCGEDSNGTGKTRRRAAALVRSTLQRTARRPAARPSGGIFAGIDAAVKRGDRSIAICGEERAADFVDYESFCEMAAAAVTQERVTGIIDLASGEPTRIVDAARAYIAAKHYPITLRIGAYPDRPQDPRSTCGDPAKIREIQKIHEILQAQRKTQTLRTAT